MIDRRSVCRGFHDTAFGNDGVSVLAKLRSSTLAENVEILGTDSRFGINMTSNSKGRFTL